MDREVYICRRSELSDLLHHSPVNNAADTDPSRPVQPPFSAILNNWQALAMNTLNSP